MKINMKEYNLEKFSDKDIYTWDEIIDKIMEYETEVYQLDQKLEELKTDIEEKYELKKFDPYTMFGIDE